MRGKFSEEAGKGVYHQHLRGLTKEFACLLVAIYFRTVEDKDAGRRCRLGPNHICNDSSAQMKMGVLKQPTSLSSREL